MTNICLLKDQLVSTGQIIDCLKSSVILATPYMLDDGSSVSIRDLKPFSRSAATKIDGGDGTSTRFADIELAKEIHVALEPVKLKCPWVLSERGFWEWLAFSELREYGLARWCEGDSWLNNPQISSPKESKLQRFVMQSDSIHSQSRHVIRRLYIYAECSIVYDGTYDHVSVVLADDLDIPGAVFERKLGLSPTLALLLCKYAAMISNRSGRRVFFKQVNLLLSSVAMEFLSESEIEDYLQKLV